MVCTGVCIVIWEAVSPVSAIASLFKLKTPRILPQTSLLVRFPIGHSNLLCRDWLMIIIGLGPSQAMYVLGASPSQ